LINADLSNANLTNTNLINANLIEKKLNAAQVENAQFGKNSGISEDAMYELKKRGAIVPSFHKTNISQR
jgi:uncharacterized protein YjbI with pentapeptide repeats